MYRLSPTIRFFFFFFFFPLLLFVHTNDSPSLTGIRLSHNDPPLTRKREWGVSYHFPSRRCHGSFTLVHVHPFFFPFLYYFLLI
jgi:hypothetical protein